MTTKQAATLAPGRLKVGQTVAKVDDVTLRAPLTVDRPPTFDGRTWHVHYRTPKDSRVEWVHYLEPGQVVELRPRRTVSYPRLVTLHGVRLRMTGPQQYETPDGAFLLYETRDEELCNDIGQGHPVRVSQRLRTELDDLIARSRAQYPELPASSHLHHAAFRLGLSDRLAASILAGLRGYWCPGGEIHERDRWTVVDAVTRDYLPHWNPQPEETLRDAITRLIQERPQYRRP
jgi:hypothetical protein